MPSLIFSLGFTLPAPQVSLMPHSSASGRPIAWKNSSTSTGVGAAPTLIASTWSSPSIARRPANTSSSARLTSSASSAGTSSPACSRRTLRIPASIAARILAACSSGWPAIIVSRPAFSFSQIRGTAKNQLGRTSGR